MINSTVREKHNFAEMTLSQIVDLVAKNSPALAKNDFIRSSAVKTIERRMMKNLKNNRTSSVFPAGIQDDRTAFSIGILHTAERALKNYDISDATLDALFNTLMKDLFIEKNYIKAGESFEQEYGCRPPTFLVVSPGKGCNLHCTGCYADSTASKKNLEWDIVDRIITEEYKLWGARFVVVSGGEPMVYRSQGKGILDLAEAHPECFFMMYTNGTLINDKVAKRMRDLGNITPAISLEGWRERTDERRGEGMFDNVMTTMDRLLDHGVPFGFSLTGTRANYREIMSDEFIDFLYFEKKALYGWLFQYMPIGRSFTLDMMPTADERLWMWKRTWEIVREKKVFLADFWNTPTITNGCLAAGGYNNGGYMYIDWDGKVSPCVFVPYTPVNVRDVYADGGDLNDVWNAPFFASIREWHKGQQNNNLMAPCIIRDHHDEFVQLVEDYKPEPSDENALDALIDQDYAEGLRKYDRAYQSLTDPIWQHYYYRDVNKCNGNFEGLPELNQSLDCSIKVK